MVKITGFDKLQRQIKEAQRAIANLDEGFGGLEFDPNDPGSIEAAIRHMDLQIEERLGAYSQNPFVAPLIEQMKDRYREGIIERASTARLKATDDE